MTQQAPHTRALDAAWLAMHNPKGEDMMTACIKAYLTTLLDSPEMVKIIAGIMRDELGSPFDIIAAIKKEAGI